MSLFAVADPLLREEEIVRLTTGWDHAVAARLAAGLLAACLFGWGLYGLSQRRARGVRAVQLLAAVALAVFAVEPQRVVNAAISIDYLMRIRAIVFVLSVGVLVTTVEAIRHGRLSERYALLWVATVGVLTVAALYPRVVALLRACTGMSYATALVCVLFCFMLLVLFHFSISLSILRQGQARLAQRIALLEARIERLEEAAGTRPPG